MIQSKRNYTDQVFKDRIPPGLQIISTTFLDCIFEQCEFNDTMLTDCRFVNCEFHKCDCSLIQVPGCTFSGTRFMETKLMGVNWSQADWADYGLGKPLEFTKCSLSHSTFIGVQLGSVKMKQCQAINVDFREASLCEADFTFTDLQDSLFQGTDLRKADLRSAKNYAIDPSQNKIGKAKFALPEAMALLYSMDIIIDEPGTL